MQQSLLDLPMQSTQQRTYRLQQQHLMASSYKAAMRTVRHGRIGMHQVLSRLRWTLLPQTSWLHSPTWQQAGPR